MIRMFDKHQCTGCGNCIPFCPKQLLELSQPSDTNKRQCRYIHLKEKQECIQCGLCELMCTAGAIKTEESIAYPLLDQQKIPPHAGCYLGSLAKALADTITAMGIQDKVVIYKKEAADVNLHIETHDYQDEQFYEDGLAYKRNHPEKLVILICSSSKEHTTELNQHRFKSLTNEQVTLINTLNWFETDDFKAVTCGGSHVLEEIGHDGKASFVARGSVKSPVQMKQLEAYLQQALQNQIDKKAFSLVEIVFPCFYRLANRPQTLMPFEQINTINHWFEHKIAIDYQEGIFNK